MTPHQVGVCLHFTPTAFTLHQTVKYIEDIQIFGKNMPFISSTTSSEAKNAYFMSAEATNEIYIFLAL